MKKKLIGIITSFSILIFLAILILYLSKGQVDPDAPNSLQEYNKSQISSVDLYNLYYLSQTLYLINDNKKQTISTKIKDISSDGYLQRSNPGLLYDIWLYIELLSEHKVNCPREEKELILDLLEEMQSKEGFFRSNLSESTSGNMSSYLLNTKMALDIFSYFEIRNRQTDTALNWIKQNTKNIINFNNPDLISDGSFLYIISYLENRYDIDLLSDTELIELTQKIKGIYPDYPDSIEKFDTVININNSLNIGLSVNKKVIENYLLSTQLKNGAFPLYGIGERADSLTTYLSIKTMKQLNLKIAHKDELNKWLYDQIYKILKISI